MHFLVLFTDAPDAPADVRTKHMPDHLAFLERHNDQISDAGPLFEGSQLAGGAWRVEADDQDAVLHLVHQDPFWHTGLRDRVRILEWRRVFAAGKRVSRE